jgi:beta-hydroxyacyl-ACP dehydratase FabZ
MDNAPLPFQEMSNRLLESGYPFCFVDKILKIEGRNFLGVKNVSLNEAFFTGHFPGQPVMPGVLILESMVQAGQILVRKTAPNVESTPTLVGVEKLKFKKPVLPGNSLLLEVELVEWNGETAKLKGHAKVGEEVAAAGNFSLSILESSPKVLFHEPRSFKSNNRNMNY